MEVDARNGIEYWLSIDKGLRDSLFGLRKWNHLKVATEEDRIWIRGFSKPEIESANVLSLPSVNRYYLKETTLYLVGNRLPERVEPSLLWTPIQRAFKLNLPKQNFNYFGIDQTLTITVVPSEKEYSVDATMIDLEALHTYVKSAPKVRMAKLYWTILNNKDALVVGTPLLPIKSEDYYLHGCFLIPGGWKLKNENLVDVYKNALPENVAYWYLIDKEQNISKIRKSDFSPLNKGSVSQSIGAIGEILELMELDE